MNIYPFAGEIKMTKVIKDGKEVVEWEQVDMSKHSYGSLGIGTPSQVKWDASAPLTMGEPVERIRFMMSNQEPAAYSFAHQTTEWARLDKDFNVTHLDMELCAKGPQNVYTALALAIWNKAVQEERNKLAAWMIERGYATGHGDSIEKLLKELEWQIEERIGNEREVCAKVCDVLAVHPEYASDITKVAAQAIRARGEK